MTLPILTAANLVGSPLVTGWDARRATRESAVMRQVLSHFVEHGGPVSVAEIAAACPDRPLSAIRATLARLDEGDLIQLRDDRIDVAYPFSSHPTAFVVQLAGGPARFACCAIDALGVAPLLGRGRASKANAITAASRSGWTSRPVGPRLPAPAVERLMVWVEVGAGAGRRITGL